MKPAELTPDQLRQQREQHRTETRERLHQALQEASDRWAADRRALSTNLTDRQEAWDTYKAEQREERKQPRGVIIAVQAPQRGSRRHACRHTRKHHKAASGRCRPGCHCDYASRRANRKARAR